MFERARRLRTATDHRRVSRAGRLIRGQYLVFRYLVTPVASRYGVVISSAVAKKATTRNLVKRRVRAALREHPITQVDAVFYATKASTKATYRQIAAEIQAFKTTIEHAKDSHRTH